MAGKHPGRVIAGAGIDVKLCPVEVFRTDNLPQVTVPSEYSPSY